ncbi:MAG: hypothetical protein E7Z89_02790 [Cyanobacteria bacterium SIG28]|nr:hypothetical protein [Cyanobacteria bacterium SIG28]
MDGFNIGKIILGLQNPELYLKKLKGAENSKINNFAPELNSALTNSKPNTNQLIQNLQSMTSITQTIQMNTLANMDRSVFIKSILGLPQNLSEALLSIQNINKPINGGTLGITGINPEMLQNQKTLSALFDETMPAINPEVLASLNTQNGAKVQQDVINLIFSGMISMTDVSKLILQNGKQAVASLIIAMATASKQGISNEQIQETISILNSCISMAESNNPTQNLKSLMMLYLPWLPLNEGVGFDLEITQPEGEIDSNDSKLTVLVQTKNFGNIKGVFTLTTSNSVDVYIICSENFPKDTLNKSLAQESTSHSMNTNIDIEVVTPKKDEINEVAETKVNLSATNEMNPYLLLMAHSFIRYTIMIDNSF